MRVALVHDWLTGLRGGERVLHQIALEYPEADLFTLFHVPGSTTQAIEARPITASLLDRLPGAHRHYRKLLPLYPWAIDRFDLGGYDLILSTSHAVAKSIRKPEEALHLCYCFTPMRYVWDQADTYLGRGARRAMAEPLARRLRRFDAARSGADTVTRFLAISSCVADRVSRHYGREARVVFPPVETARIRPSGDDPHDYYLLVSGFVPYKREALAIEAFARRGDRLVVVGDGPGRSRLQAGAPSNVEFVGRVGEAELREAYANCRALIHPQLEDFGLIAVEAQAAGRPVIAYGAGGVLDSVRDLDRAQRSGEEPTGLFFHQQSSAALGAALDRFEACADHFDAAAIRRHAETFDADAWRPRYRAEVQAMIEAKRQGRSEAMGGGG